MRSSLVPHAVLLTHPGTMKCTLVVSQHRQKAVCKSRPGNLLSSARCFWIVHECAYHVQAKDGFQFLCLYGRFSKIRSHIVLLVLSVDNFCNCTCALLIAQAFKSNHVNCPTMLKIVNFTLVLLHRLCLCEYPVVTSWFSTLITRFVLIHRRHHCYKITFAQPNGCT